jgi:hypothetical protein
LFSLEVFSSKIENENIKTFRKHLDWYINLFHY